MVDKEYVQNFNELSGVFSSKSVFSMAKVGKLHKLRSDISVPYYQDNKEVGRVQLPEDLFRLLSVPGIEVQVWYSDSASHSTNRDNAFRLRIVGYDDVPGIDIFYGMVSQVQRLIVYGWDPDEDKFECSVPDGFSLVSLVDILNKGTLKDFVLKHSTNLSQSKRQEIITYGLC